VDRKNGGKRKSKNSVCKGKLKKGGVDPHWGKKEFQGPLMGGQTDMKTSVESREINGI